MYYLKILWIFYVSTSRISVFFVIKNDWRICKYFYLRTCTFFNQVSVCVCVCVFVFVCVPCLQESVWWPRSTGMRTATAPLHLRFPRDARNNNTLFTKKCSSPPSRVSLPLLILILGNNICLYCLRNKFFRGDMFSFVPPEFYQRCKLIRGGAECFK